LSTESLLTPPTLKSINSEPAADAVSVTSNLMPVKVVAALFQVAEMGTAGLPPVVENKSRVVEALGVNVLMMCPYVGLTA
jgi:hypothetical protein